ncbi:MAG: hypothetical protein IKU96_06300 [Alistipes sp.]|nr:hypothetical protein [Alistipes sp.]
MKNNRKQKAILATIYTLFVVGLLLGTRCESRVHLTTPEKDAQHLAHLAETVHTEADLREVERLASQYEIAYRKSYSGAKALYFKSLYEPILDEAGERRAAFRAEEDYLNEQQTTLNTTISDLNAAWTVALGDEAEELKKLAENKILIENMRAELELLVVAKEEYAEKIIEEGYPQEMLNEIGKMEEEIMSKEAEIAEMEHKNEIIILANKLQLGRELRIVEEVSTIDTEELL